MSTPVLPRAGRAPKKAPWKVVWDVPALGSVALRHLVRDTDHVRGVPLPGRSGPEYAAALAALQAGDLGRARDLARRGGPVGRVLARLVEGDLALLTAPLPEPPLRSAPVPAGLDRVLHLVTNALPETVAGYTLRTQGIAGAQRRAGHHVDVVTRLGFPVLKGHLAASPTVAVQGVPHHRLLPGRLPLRADDCLAADVARSARLVERLQPTVLHAHSNHANGRVGLALRRRYGVPLVYEVRGLLEETWLSRTARPGGPDPDALASDFYRLTRAAETGVMRAADAVVTLSAAMRAEVVSRGVPAERVHVVPNGVDPSWLAAAPTAYPADGPLTVGLGGTLNDYEGVDVLVQAVALLRGAGHDVRLLVVGDGPAREALEKRAADLGVADVATFTGRLPHEALVAAYRDLDVFCLPRLDLPVTRLVPPLKPVEAMALGIPVVASDLPPLRELVGSDRGRLVPPGDPAALATAIAALTPAATRRALGTAARSWVAATRSWDVAATTYQDVYADAHTDPRTTTRGETP
ncbi:glycosyltransferase family 4 protein [Nocardioides sp.]|uniref:glycosyltransferase family 4 protein n=1 Tax=Nocardioides sp. TaxID=35761 RepID=UPI0037841433